MKTQHFILFAFCISILSPATIATANGDIAYKTGTTITRLPDAQLLVPDYGFPGQQQGRYQSRNQLVWNNAEGKLVRRHYEVWNPTPSLGLQFTWTAAQDNKNTSKRVTGKGELVWRKPDRPSYDKTAIIARFNGQMRDGKAHGEGKYLDRSGRSYKGGWQNGLMHGHGRLQRVDGDEFSGVFANGLPHGKGRYISANGSIYEGDFFKGDRHGKGRFSSPNGEIYEAQWQNGLEVERSRTIISHIKKAQAIVPAIDVGVTIDSIARIESDHGDDVIKYHAFSEGETIKIEPLDPLLMKAWRRDGSGIVEPLKFSKNLTNDFTPLGLSIYLNNRQNQNVSVNGAYLDFISSKNDNTPLLSTSLNNVSPQGDTLYGDYLYSMNIMNSGWANISGVSIKTRFFNKEMNLVVENKQRKIQVKNYKDTKILEIDLIPDLKSSSFNLENFPNTKVSCPSKNPYTCLQKFKNSNFFGGLNDLVYVTREVQAYDRFAVRAQIEISYEWYDNSSYKIYHEKLIANSEFELYKTDIPYNIQREGEGGESTVLFKNPTILPENKGPYRLNLPISGQIPAGTAGRWNLQLGSRRNSRHLFKVVFVLSDGRTVASRPIDFLFYHPSNPWKSKRNTPWTPKG